MSNSSKCLYSSLLGLVLAMPAVVFGQSTPAPADQTTAAPAPAAAPADQTTTASAQAPAGATTPADSTSAAAPAQAPAATPAPAPAPAPAPEAAAPPTWSAGPIDFSGRVDVYYTYNSNHPGLGGCSTPATCGNQLYNFNVQPNQFSLNMLEFGLDHSPDPVGFHIVLGYGRAFDIIAGSEPGANGQNIFRFVKEAYVSFKPAKAKGFEFDFGKFVTSAGAEVIETDSNWNYSRSLLFAWAIPYYHFGLRTSFPVGKHFTGGVQLVNGWNNVEDNNTGKTVGFNGTVTYAKWNWTGDIYMGPENTNTNKGWRYLYDTTIMLTPNAKFNAYINYDYGSNAFPNNIPTKATWQGVALALHYMPNSKWSFTPRIEYYTDPQGFNTGTPQDVKEFTMTGEYKFLAGLLARAEYRYDWTNKLFFIRGVPGTVPNVKNQTTATFGIVAFFGPKR